jgi:hypothetical protein
MNDLEKKATQVETTATEQRMTNNLERKYNRISINESWQK